jgi:two-component system LytT family response regulator
MPVYRCIIVDDEPLARQGLRRALESDRELRVVAECGDGVEAIRKIGEQRPDLVLLDIEMPEVDGFDVVAALGRGRLPAIIFVTAYNRYAIEAFNVHAADYVLKPVDPSRLAEAVGRAKTAVALRRTSREHEKLLRTFEDMQTRAGRIERLAVKWRGATKIVRLDDVDWIEAADDYLVLHRGSERLLHRQTLQALGRLLDPREFVRIHRSTIVNVRSVSECLPRHHGDAVVRLRDGTSLDVSRTYRARLDAALTR